MRGLILAALMALRALQARLVEVPHLDKWLHAGGGAAIAALTWWLTGSAAAGVFAAVAVGLGKELYDLRHPARHTADLVDAGATVVGALVLWIVVDLVGGAAWWGVPLLA